MKKLAITAASLLAALSVHAQGTVFFNNFFAPGGVRNEMTGALVTSADGIVAQLYWSLTMDGVYMAAGAPIPVGSAFGTDAAGFFGNPQVTLDGLQPSGGLAFVEVRAWEAAYGATYEEAIAAGPMGGRVALRGSALVLDTDPMGDPMGRINTGDPTADPPGLPADLGALIPAFSVDVPEPSVIALGVLGAGALLLLRRRK